MTNASATIAKQIFSIALKTVIMRPVVYQIVTENILNVFRIVPLENKIFPRFGVLEEVVCSIFLELDRGKKILRSHSELYLIFMNHKNAFLEI